MYHVHTYNLAIEYRNIKTAINSILNFYKYNSKNIQQTPISRNLFHTTD